MRILIGITGSIAAYKAADLIRKFVKNGDEVKVVVTLEALKFIGILTLEALSNAKVLVDGNERWDQHNEGSLNHIGFAKWADVFIVAPASANSIAKMAQGLADNILLQTILAFDKKLLVAPAMNSKMLQNPLVQNNLKILSQHNVSIVAPKYDLLACNDIGKGALADIDAIFFSAQRAFFQSPSCLGKTVIITAGGTQEAIDDFRCITNYSSAKQGYFLALNAYILGFDVIFIASKTVGFLPHKVQFLPFDTTQELKTQLHSIKKADFLLMCAAVSDFICENPKKGKIKKTEQGIFTLKLKSNEDLLENFKLKNCKKIGFKAETSLKIGIQNAKKAIKEKNLNAICLNIINNNHGFNSQNNEIFFFKKEWPLKIKGDISNNTNESYISQTLFSSAAKNDIARQIVTQLIDFDAK